MKLLLFNISDLDEGIKHTLCQFAGDIKLDRSWSAGGQNALQRMGCGHSGSVTDTNCVRFSSGTLTIRKPLRCWSVSREGHRAEGSAEWGQRKGSSKWHLMLPYFNCLKKEAVVRRVSVFFPRWQVIGWEEMALNCPRGGFDLILGKIYLNVGHTSQGIESPSLEAFL